MDICHLCKKEVKRVSTYPEKIKGKYIDICEQCFVTKLTELTYKVKDKSINKVVTNMFNRVVI